MNGPLVLFADDDADTRDLFSLTLSLSGFSVEVARNGEEAWDRTQALIPQAVVTDIVLPGIDGFELCRRIKGDTRTAAIPVLAVSGYTRPGYLDEASRAGFHSFLLKPISPDDLVAKVRGAVEASRQVRAASRAVIADSLGRRGEVRRVIERSRGLTADARALCRKEAAKKKSE
jgi:CheY-like chemotaxis protein